MIVSKMNLIIYKGQTMATYLEHLLQKFDYKIDQTNIKEFLEALQKLEEHQHKIFLEDLKKTLQLFDNNIKQEIENF